jgi:hypothetical protein
MANGETEICAMVHDMSVSIHVQRISDVSVVLLVCQVTLIGCPETRKAPDSVISTLFSCDVFSLHCAHQPPPPCRPFVWGTIPFHSVFLLFGHSQVF